MPVLTREEVHLCSLCIRTVLSQLYVLNVKMVFVYVNFAVTSIHVGPTRTGELYGSKTLYLYVAMIVSVSPYSCLHSVTAFSVSPRCPPSATVGHLHLNLSIYKVEFEIASNMLGLLLYTVCYPDHP